MGPELPNERLIAAIRPGAFNSASA
jgi:hypothetical protein